MKQELENRLRSLQNNPSTPLTHQREVIDVQVETIFAIDELNGEVKKLNGTIRNANDKNDKLQKLFLGLTILGTLFAASQLIQLWDILARGIGK